METFDKTLSTAVSRSFKMYRVFNTNMAKAFDNAMNYDTLVKDKCFSIRNNNDGVSKIPGPPYEPIGTEIYIDRL